ncbi:hypothetical protein D3C80_1826490 [compost metagenome]
MERAHTQEQIAHPVRHPVYLADDVGNALLQQWSVHFLRQFGAGADGGQGIAQAVGDRTGHLPEANVGLVGDQLVLL